MTGIYGELAVRSLIDREPAYRDQYVGVIEHCAQGPTDEFEAAKYADGLKKSAAQAKQGASIVATLVEHGALSRTIIVDGQEYAGTLEQFQSDDTLPETAHVEFFVRSTEAGVAAAQLWRKVTDPATLFNESPGLAEGFRTALQCANNPNGASTQDIQDALIDAGVVKPGTADAQTLHASYFTSKLEKHGALVWSEKRWRVTDKGVAAIAD